MSNVLQFTHDTVRMMGLQALGVYMLLRCAEQEGIVPVSAQWLLDHMPDKTSPNTITKALRWLTSPEHQIAVRVTGGWRLNRENAFQMPLGYDLPDDQNHSQRGFKNLPESENHSVRDSCSAVVVVDDLSENVPTITTTTTLTRDQNHSLRDSSISRGAASKKNPLFDANIAMLTSLEIFGRKARTVADLEWVHPDYIKAHVEWARDKSWIDNPEGFALAQMAEQVPAPAVIEIKKSDLSERSKYVSGQYADFIEH